MLVYYEVHDGQAIFQGDIDLGPEADLGKTPPSGTFSSSRDNQIGVLQQPLVVISSERFLWPGGIVPYTIDGNVGDNLDDEIQIALNEWLPTNLQFIPRTDERVYIHFLRDNAIPGNGQSGIGRPPQGGRRTIKLRSTAPAATVIHEMGHAIGLWHEQSRGDRDEFVEVLWDNIEPGLEHNFYKHLEDGMDIGPYDVNSIMHYDAFSFGRRDPSTGRLLPTLQSIVPGLIIDP